MIITKIIEVGINVRDTINLYTDPDNIRQIVSDRYEGKCFKDCYIKKINKILREGECIPNQDGRPDFGTISVTCEITAIEYAAGEIINGCVVKNRDKNNIIICTTDVASIMLAPNPLLESISAGQIISVRVGVARYVSTSNKISISAIPYLPTQEPIIYKFGQISAKDKPLFNDVLERIKNEEAIAEKLKKENSKAWSTFDQMLYAYKEPQSVPAGAVEININELITKPPAFVSRDSRINLSNPIAYGYTAAKFPPNARVITNFPPATVLLLMFEDYCAHLRTIREMVSIYNTEEIILNHRNIWQIFRKRKF